MYLHSGPLLLSLNTQLLINLKITTMTYDKTIHYLGEGLTKFISSLNRADLLKMKGELLKDIELHIKGSEILFKRNVELQYINYLLS